MSENEEKPIIIYVKAATLDIFVKKLNEAVKQGYRPVWSMYNIHASIDFFVICELTDTVDTERMNETKAELSQKIMEAEFQAAKANNELTEQTDKLRLNTNWDELNEQRVGKNLAKLTNKEGREAYINEQTKKAAEWVGTTKRWLAHVKRLEKIGVLPGKAPWEECESDVEQVKIDPDVERYLEEYEVE